MGRSHRRMSSLKLSASPLIDLRDELFVRPRHAERGRPSLCRLVTTAATATRRRTGQSVAPASQLYVERR